MQQPFATSARRRRREKSSATPSSRFVRLLDSVLGALIILLITAGPWLFGCTEVWSIRLVNLGCFAAGACGLLRRFLDPKTSEAPAVVWPSRLFLATNLLLLGFCLVAVLNARASFSIETQEFTYRTGVISWLPTSYDRNRSFQFLLNASALFSLFWTVHFWLNRAHSSSKERSLRRLKLLLWVFAANGFLLALQGILQRLSGRAELLWFRTPFSDDPRVAFGPFAYRGNAADYLNLVWPVTFGFWYFLAHQRVRRAFGVGDGPELLLLPMFMVTAMGTFVSLSRGGSAVAAGMLILLFGWLLISQTSRVLRLFFSVAAALLIGAAFLLSGSSLLDRFKRASTDNMSGRTEIYENARQIAADFPWLGTGPGTFLSVYHLYRQRPEQSWAAFLHDDWLETRVTFGRVGMAIVLAQLGLLFFWTWTVRRRWLSPVLMFSLIVSVSGCLVHAKRDFPFQTYGVFLTFVVVSALLVSAVSQSAHSSYEQSVNG
jgi:O-antigen ligase